MANHVLLTLQVLLELPQNTTLVQSEHMEHYSKVPMTAPAREVSV